MTGFFFKRIVFFVVFFIRCSLYIPSILCIPSKTMLLTTIWQQLQCVQEAVRQESREAQDIAIAALQDTLATGPPSLFPSFVYPLLTDVLHFYCRNVLPSLGISIEDLRVVREAFERTITHLNTQESTAKQIEVQLKQLFAQVKSGGFETIEELVRALRGIALSGNADITSGHPFPASKRKQTQNRQETGESHSSGRLSVLDLSALRFGSRAYRTLQRSPFTAQHVMSFFDALLDDALPDDTREAVAAIYDLFWHQLHELLDIKSVLVNPKAKEALIMHFDIRSFLQSNGFDELVIKNTSDNQLYCSCWNAVQAARAFLEEYFPDVLKNRSLHVSCRFPNQIAEYTDTSTSLLVSLKVIGDVLDLEIEPHTVVSGEVDVSGKILPVACMAEKMLAAQQHPEIHRILLPAEGMFMTSRRIDVIRVRDLSEAILQYYGEPFRKKLTESHRKQTLGHVGDILAAPVLTAQNPVTDRDLRLINDAKEFYQKEGRYRIATDILDSFIARFQREDSAEDALRLKAQALGHVGVIYTQQNQLKKSLRVLYQALQIWERLRDREQYVNTLFRIGSVYRYDVIVNGNIQQWKMALTVYQQAYRVLRPSIKEFPRLQGKYYGRLGYLYYWIGNYSLAERYSRQSMEYFDDHDTTIIENYHQWNSQTARQHLGRVLMKRGRYDQAYDILESTANAPVLQTPHNQVRSLWTLSEFFFSQQHIEKGLEYAEKAEQLCQGFGLISQQRIITNLLARYNVLPQKKP